MRFLKTDHWLSSLLKTSLRAVRPERVTGLLGLPLALLICPCINTLAQVRPQTGALLPLSITILYFDQSSPVLRPGVKTTLDSLAQVLVEQPTLIATVTGYTDAIGKRELNLVLAEHRAKAVGSYLVQRGVRKDRIIANWEGPDKKAVTADSDVVSTIGRRVVVQLLPK